MSRRPRRREPAVARARAWSAAARSTRVAPAATRWPDVGEPTTSRSTLFVNRDVPDAPIRTSATRFPTVVGAGRAAEAARHGSRPSRTWLRSPGPAPTASTSCTTSAAPMPLAPRRTGGGDHPRPAAVAHARATSAGQAGLPAATRAAVRAPGAWSSSRSSEFTPTRRASSAWVSTADRMRVRAARRSTGAASPTRPTTSRGPRALRHRRPAVLPVSGDHLSPQEPRDA